MNLIKTGDPRSGCPAEGTEAAADDLTLVLPLLREAYGLDSSCYEPSTIERYAARRLHGCHAADMSAYVEQLRADRVKLDALYQDLFVGVTGFFQDEHAFCSLERKVLSGMLRNLDEGDELRVWSVGCATGEEAYSLAILIHEQSEELGCPCKAKIFATDVHGPSLDAAYHGVYDKRAVAGLEPDRLEKYFIHNAHGYQISTELRQMIIFATHNILKDAPFMGLDLISCRNLMIYLQPAVQEKSLRLFHASLKPGGVLFLGPHEGCDEIVDEFDVADRQWQIFRKRRDVRLDDNLHKANPSANEEPYLVDEGLGTIIAEYEQKIAELTELTDETNDLLLSADVHTLLLDEELCIRKFTPKMAEVFHLIPVDVGRRINGFAHTIERDDLQTIFSEVLSQGERYEDEVRTRDGDEFLMRILPYGHSNRCGGVAMTLIDITGFKVAETQFSNAVEAAPSGMLMVDGGGQITLINSELERMFGYDRNELLGQPIETLIPARFREQHVAHRQQYFQQPHRRPMGAGLNLWGVRKDGTEFPLDLRLSPINTSRGPAVMAAVVDVTDRQRLELSLRDQVVQRDQFLATLSHELRNPMAAILAAASMLSRVANDLPETQRPCGVIRRQASQMATLLDDLLDVSRLTQNKIKLRCELTDLTLLIKEAIEAVTPLVSRHEHQVYLDICDEPLWADVDRARILQILENLLTNAIKYTPNEGNIWITLSQEDGQALIQVRDDGRGIAPELLNSIFDMFVQADDTLDRSEGGMGVGLTLVRSLVELHQGLIEAHSAGVNQGSEFIVRLPLTTRRPKEDPQLKKPCDPQDLRIVLVEDAADAREMLAALLSWEGYQVETACNGQEGLQAILQGQPDAALLDIGLPDLDGYQVARQVRERFTKNEVLLIALTGYGREEDHEAVLKAGFDEHLVKPVKLEALTAALKKAVLVS